MEMGSILILVSCSLGYYYYRVAAAVADNRYKPSHALERLDKGRGPQYGPNNNWLTPHTALSILTMTSHPDYPLSSLHYKLGVSTHN